MSRFAGVLLAGLLAASAAGAAEDATAPLKVPVFEEDESMPDAPPVWHSLSQRRDAPSKEVRAIPPSLTRRLLRERRDDLTAGLPDSSGGVGKIVGSVILGLSSATLWALTLAGTSRWFVYSGANLGYAVLFIAAAVLTVSELVRARTDREAMEGEIRDVDRRILALDRAR